MIVARAMWRLGIVASYRRRFWRLLLGTALRARHAFPWAIAHAIMGEHVIRYTVREFAPAVREWTPSLRYTLESRLRTVELEMLIISARSAVLASG